MKSKFPNYRKKGIGSIKIEPKDQEILDKFMELINGSASPQRAKNLKRIMLILYDISEVSYDAWDLDILRGVTAVLNKSDRPNSSINDIKKVMKRFLKENYNDWEERFKNLKDPGIKMKKELNEEKINKKVLITPEELDLMLRDKKTTQFYQAYVSCAMETAGRPSELLNTKWKDWDFKNNNVKLFSTKNNKIRILPIKDCIYYLKQHKQNFPYPNVAEGDYVFASPRDRTKPISLSSLHNFFTRLTSSLLRRQLKPYIMRHTRLNFLIKKLSPKVYEQFSDHSHEMGKNTYSHIDDEDLNEEMYDKVFKRKELSQEEKDRIEELKKEVKDLKVDFLLTMRTIAEAVETNNPKKVRALISHFKER